MQPKRFSRIFHDIEDVITYSFFNDLVKIIEYRDDLSDYYNQKRTHRVGLRIGDNVEWGPWEDPYEGMDEIKPVYRALLDSRIDNAFEGIV